MIYLDNNICIHNGIYVFVLCNITFFWSWGRILSFCRYEIILVLFCILEMTRHVMVAIIMEYGHVALICKGALFLNFGIYV